MSLKKTAIYFSVILFLSFFTVITPVLQNDTAAIEAVVRALPGKAALKLTTDPPNAIVTIDGRKLEQKTPVTVTDINPGTHDLIIEKDFYKLKKRILFKLGEVKELGYMLLIGRGVLKVDSVSRGSLVYIDGNSAGKTPLRKVVLAGKHRLGVVWITQNSAHNYERKIEIIQNDLLEIRVSRRQFKKRKLKEGDTYLVPMGVSGKLELQYIPGGTFNMGAYSRADDQHPVHKVSLSPFWIGRYEITQAQWRAVTGGNVSYFYNEQHSHTHYQGGTLPAEQVSWASLEKFFQRLNRITGKKFRLPTEAEWEYAARAGSPGDYFGGGGVSLLPDFAWFKDNSELGTHLIGGKKPNAWGVYDMTGNVAEWCQDWYSPDFYASAARKDPVNTGKPEKNPRKVVRGGSWFNEKDILYLSYRNKISVKRTKPPVGFRVALPVTGKTGEK